MPSPSLRQVLRARPEAGTAAPGRALQPVTSLGKMRTAAMEALWGRTEAATTSTSRESPARLHVFVT